MTVVWDQRSHGTVSLVSNELKDFQGPALCVANDAQFSDEVFSAIIFLAASILIDFSGLPKHSKD